MRLLLLLPSLLAMTLSGPALADPSQSRRANEAAMAREADRARAAAWEREARARAMKARADAVIRALPPGELAGGPSSALPPLRPSAIEPLPPRASAPPPVLTGSTARSDELMARAMARSTARVRAMTGETPN